MTHPLRVGIKLSPQVHPVATQRAVWRIADEAGFDHVWGFDHLASLGGDPTRDVYEGWAMLAAMAEATTRTRIGLMVTGNLYRHPGQLAKLAVTVDHLSGGRLEFGIGAAWNELEFKMMGLPFPGPADRIRMLNEACKVVKLLWTEPRATFAGRYYQIQNAIAEPKPVQRPHPPIWIGGSGPKRTLRVVARHADVWNGAGRSVAEDIASSKLLDEHCATVKPDPNEIRRSEQIRYESVKDALAKSKRFIEAGFSEIILMVGGADPAKNAETAAREILPQLRAMA